MALFNIGGKSSKTENDTVSQSQILRDSNQIPYKDDKKLELDATSIEELNSLTQSLISTVDDDEKKLLKKAQDIYGLHHILSEHMKRYEEYKGLFAEEVAKQAESDEANKPLLTHGAKATEADTERAVAAGEELQRVKDKITEAREKTLSEKKEIASIINLICKKIDMLIQVKDDNVSDLQDYKDWLENEAKQHFQDVHNTYHPNP